MKKNALDTAIRIGQLIRLLTPIANGCKSFNKRLARLRSSVDEQVLLAALGGDTAYAKRAERSIEDLENALRASMVRYLNIPTLLERSRKERSVYPSQVAKAAARRTDVERALLADAEAVLLDKAENKGIAQTARAHILHAYTSAVKNASWMSTLLRLDVTLSTANTENAHLVKEHSSHQGRERLQATLLKLCPTYEGSVAAARRGRSKKPAVTAEGLYVTQVAFKAETLLAQPDIAALADSSFLSAEAQPSLAQLLEKASTPVVVGPDEAPQAVAQRVLDELVTSLVARKKAIDAEKDQLRKKAEEAAKASTVEALKQMNPQLLKVLKNNPDLLKAL
ncbi:hypothetical protein [Burkholderia ubonensis]|uniref:hypothetical protein n=1 Tax=Burkholderia ubonensis TaxID=101571 RepID=UPI0007597ED8|nr:hypothetical protein [Burkholderia ubonensis]KVP17139.1 hypothetical protein WJ84_02345 [Burkholderia ubonensis]